MNRKNRHILAILVALGMLLLALPMAASAAAPVVTADDAQETTGTLTIVKAGSTFSVYKLASASVVEGASAYTYTAAGTAFEDFFTGSYALTDAGIGAITGFTSASQKLATDLEAYIVANSVSATRTGIGSNDPQTLEIGYYLIVETGTSSATATVASKAMLVSIPTADYSTTPSTWDFSVTATLKDTEGKIEKKIVEGESLVDGNTAAIGDTIPYKITATVPDYDDSVSRNSIVYKITDTMSAGLDYVEGSLAVTYYGTSPATVLTPGTDYTITHAADASANATESIVLTFTFGNLESILEGTGSDLNDRDIVVTFNATLNKNADQTTAGNPNDVQLTYTNNPSVADDYYTDDDKVITYTTGLAVEKYSVIDNVTTDLAGAQFTLKDSDDNVIATYTYDATGTPTVTAGTAVTDADGMIYFPGLDAGVYTLTETVAPAGYSLLENPVTITITSSVTGTTDDKYQLPIVEFDCTTNFGDVNEDLVKPTTVTGDTNKLFFEVQIANEAGWTLPGTGGSGTRVFTIGGIALIVLSGIVLLIAMKRRSSKTK